MNKFVAFIAPLLLLGGGAAGAAQGGASVACKDGAKQHAGNTACSNHGGAQEPII